MSRYVLCDDCPGTSGADALKHLAAIKAKLTEPDVQDAIAAARTVAKFQERSMWLRRMAEVLVALAAVIEGTDG